FVPPVQFFVERVELLVGRLQFFLGGIELFIGRLQLFVAGQDFFVGRLQLFVGRFQILDDRLQILAAGGQFQLQTADLFLALVLLARFAFLLFGGGLSFGNSRGAFRLVAEQNQVTAVFARRTQGNHFQVDIAAVAVVFDVQTFAPHRCFRLACGAQRG